MLEQVVRDAAKAAEHAPDHAAELAGSEVAERGVIPVVGGRGLDHREQLSELNARGGADGLRVGVGGPRGL